MAFLREHVHVHGARLRRGARIEGEADRVLDVVAEHVGQRALARVAVVQGRAGLRRLPLRPVEEEVRRIGGRLRDRGAEAEREDEADESERTPHTFSPSAARTGGAPDRAVDVGRRASADASLVARSRMRAWNGDFKQAGSVARASPASASAWQRQPPQSFSRAVAARGRAPASSPCRDRLEGRRIGARCRQANARVTYQKTRPGIVSAAWQGSTLPGASRSSAAGPSRRRRPSGSARSSRARRGR